MIFEKELTLKQAISSINDASSIRELDVIRQSYLGKKGIITTSFKEMSTLPAEEKKKMGVELNSVKTSILSAISERKSQLSLDETVDFDVTLPIPVDMDEGSLSPITTVSKEVCEILKSMGFRIISGPEIELEENNFDLLNIPATHPAREMHDTYWTEKKGVLLRTHTSPCQVRALKKYGAPVKIAAPGRCFRNEDVDAGHETTFFQMEGMVIDKEVSIGNLLYVMKQILSIIFKRDVKVRLRPGFFPFVEPGFEMDVECHVCYGKGCPTCKNTGWLELCPCGMVHPKVLENCGINSKIYSGFAFGFGFTRLTMMKYGVSDIRVFNSGKLDALLQFK